MAAMGRRGRMVLAESPDCRYLPCVVQEISDSKPSSEPIGRGPLSSRNFRFYLALRAPIIVAAQIQSVAIGWQVYDITNRPLDLGLIGLAQFVPVFGLVLVAGHVADRFDRRLVLACCLILQFLCAALLYVHAAGGATNIWPIYGVALLLGVSRAFSMPASQALMPSLVPREHLGGAFAWNSSMFQAATIAGPAMGGFLYAWGAATVYAIAGGLLLVAMVSLACIRAPRRQVVEQRGVRWDSLLAGIRFIRARPEILGALSLDLFAVLFGGATALLPIYAKDILQTGPVGLGLLRSAPAVGATLVGLILAHRSLGRHTGRTMFLNVAIFGLCTIVFAVSTNFAVSLAALFVLGAADMVSMFVRQNLVQRATPDEMRGRVSAVNGVFIGASNEFGEFESGVTAQWFGAVGAVVLGGVGTLAVVAIWAWRFPELRRVDRLEDIHPR